MRVSDDAKELARRVRASAEDAGQAWAVALCDAILAAYWHRYRISPATVGRVLALADELEIA